MSDRDLEVAKFATIISKFALHGRVVTRLGFKNGLPPRASSPPDSARTSPSSSPPREPPVNTNRKPRVSSDTSLKRTRSNENSARETLMRRPTKRKRKEPGPPDPTLQPVPDILADELDVLFCGINPGVTSSRKGHHFSHPTNRFWPALYAGELTEMQLRPEDDATLPFLPIKMGLTNLCGRPSQVETDLHTDEHGIGADILIKKLQERRPRIVCFVGMGIWKAFFSYLTAFKCIPRESMASSSSSGSKKKKAGYSPEDALMPFKLVHSQERDTLDDDKTTIKREDPPVVACGPPTVKVEPDDEQPLCSLDDNKMAPITETLFFVMPNTSGLVAGYKRADYANFIATLKQRVLEGRAGILNTSTFTEIEPSQR